MRLYTCLEKHSTNNLDDPIEEIMNFRVNVNIDKSNKHLYGDNDLQRECQPVNLD